MGERELPPGFFPIISASPASPTTSATKKKKKGGQKGWRGREGEKKEQREGGREGGEREGGKKRRRKEFSQRGCLRDLQSGCPQKPSQKQRQLVVSKLTRDLGFQKQWYFRFGSTSTYLAKLRMGKMGIEINMVFKVFSVEP